MLPSYIKIGCDNPKKFKLILQKCLYKNSFYSVDEYFELKKKLLFVNDLRSILKFGTLKKGHFILFLNYIFSFVSIF